MGVADSSSKKKPGGVHQGHRQRVKQEFMARGLAGMPDHRALELLLFFSIPQGDVNPLAHELVEQFGSLAGVFNATREQLLAVKGIGGEYCHPHPAHACPGGAIFGGALQL